MINTNPVVIGLTLIVIGTSIYLLLPLFMLAVERIRQMDVRAGWEEIADQESGNNRALLIIRSGGILGFANALARTWLNIEEIDRPELDWLAESIYPADDFYRLCAEEGQAELLVNGVEISAYSYRVPTENEIVMIISMEEELSLDDGVDGAFDLLQKIDDELLLSDSIQHVLEIVLKTAENLIDVEAVQLLITDDENGRLAPAVSTEENYLRQKIYPEALDQQVFISQQTTFIQDLSVTDHGFTGAYYGFPLLTGGQCFGVLSLKSKEPHTASSRQLAVAGSLSRMVANAVSSVESQQDKTDILESFLLLQDLLQLRDSVNTTEQLTALFSKKIGSALGAATVGFFLPDHAGILLPQNKFYGVVEGIEQKIGAENLTDLTGLKLILNQEDEPQTDADDGDFHLLLQETGDKNAGLIPLMDEGSLIGLLYLGGLNQDYFKVEESETRKFFELLGTVCQEAVLETLKFQTERSASRQLQIINQISSMPTPNQSQEQNLKTALDLTAAVDEITACCLLTENQAVGSLQLQSNLQVGLPLISSPNLVSISDSDYQETVTASRKLTAVENIRTDNKVPAVYKHLAELAGNTQSLFSVPVMWQKIIPGELVFMSSTAGMFSPSTQDIWRTAAENILQISDTDEISPKMNAELNDKLLQLFGILRLSSGFNQAADETELVHIALERTKNLINGAEVRLYLLKENSIVQIEGNENSQQTEYADLPLIVRETVHTKSPILVEDFGISSFRPPETGVESCLVVPLESSTGFAGVLGLYFAEKTNNLDDLLPLVQAFSNQFSSALTVIREKQEISERAHDLEGRIDALSGILLSAQYQFKDQGIDSILESAALSIRENSPFEAVIIYMLDKETETYQAHSSSGLLMDKIEISSELIHPVSEIEPYLQERFQVGSSYLIPSADRPKHKPLVPLSTTLAYAGAPQSDDPWEIGDTFLVPIRLRDDLAGFICLDAPRNNARPDASVIFKLEKFAQEIGRISADVSGHINFSADLQRSELGKSKVELQSIEEQISRLLHKDLEQTLALQQVFDRARRVRVGLEIAELVNQQPDRSSVLQVLGNQMITRLGFDSILIAESSPNGPRLVSMLGSQLPGINPDALLGQRNPLSQSLADGRILMVENLSANADWKLSPLLANVEAQAFISLPIIINDEVEAALLAVSSSILGKQTAEDEQIYNLIGNQVAIAMQNLKLLTETRRRLREVNLLLDFSQELGSLDPTEILSTLVESALQVMGHAHAGVVLIWEEKSGLLIPQAARGYTNSAKILEIQYQAEEALPGKAFTSGEPLRINEIDFASHYNLNPENLLLYREAAGGRVPVSSMLIPLKAGEKPLGILIVDNFNTIGAFTAEDEALVLSLTKQTALTLENARLFQASDQRAKQLQTLTDVAAAISSNLNTDTLTASLLDLQADVLPSEKSTLWLRQGEQLIIRAVKGDGVTEKIGESSQSDDNPFLQEILSSGEVLVIPNTQENALTNTQAFTECSSLMGVPLTSKGAIVGIIVLEKEEENYYSPEHVQTATAFAGQAAVAISNARLYEYSIRRAQELVNRSQRLAQLNQISTELSASLDIEHLIKYTVRELSQAVRCDSASAVLFMDDGEISLAAEQPISDKHLPLVLPKAEIFDWINHTKNTYFSEEAQQDEKLAPLLKYLKDRDAETVLMIPMATSSLVHGVFIIQVRDSYHFRSGEMDLARTICNQAAVSIENARFFQQSEQRSMELSTLLETASAASSTLELEELLEAIAEQMVKALDVDGVEIFRWDQANDCMITWIGWHEEGIVYGERIADILLFSEYPIRRQVIETNQPIILHRAEKDIDPGELKLMEAKQIGSKLMLPLIIGDRTLGMVELQETEPRDFSPAEIRLAQALSDQAAVAIENARLFEETRSFSEELEQRVKARTQDLENEHLKSRALLHIGNLLSSSFNLDMVMNESLQILNETVGSEQSMVILKRNDSVSLQYRAGAGIDTSPPFGGQPSTLDRKEGIAGWVIGERKPVLINNLKEDKRWKVDNLSGVDYHSAVAAPLIVGEEALGALILLHRNWNFFSPVLLDMVQSSANRFAVAVNNSELYQLIRNQADDLGNMLRTQEVETSQTRAMLEGVAEGVLVTDVEGTITLFNQAAEKILALKGRHVISKSLEDFIGLFGGAAQSWMDTIHQWLNEKMVMPNREPYSEEITMEDGKVVEVTLAPVSAAGEFLGTISIFRDITHLIEVSRLKSEFVATVSHELRTPITPIKGYVDILLMGGAGEINEKQREFLEVVKSNTTRLTSLVDDLLNVSRIEAGESRLTREMVNLPELAKESAAELEDKYGRTDKNISVHFTTAKNFPEILADESMMRTVLNNILDNAFRYTEHQGAVKVRFSYNDAAVDCSIQDQGIGIAKDEQERVFDRFYRGENPLVMASAGTGLGLPIVKDIIEMHGGTIRLESKGIPGKGTKIIFSLPIV